MRDVFKETGKVAVLGVAYLLASMGLGKLMN